MELCAAGTAPDPVAFAAGFPAAARARISAQCQTYLEFDGLVGAKSGKSTPQANEDRKSTRLNSSHRT